jgi:uncharacterized protein (TIGR02284 family)
LNIQAALSDNDEKAILDECHRGENTAIAIYEAAMTRALPDYIFNIIQSQYEQLTLMRKRLLEQLDSLNTQEK